MAEVQPTCDTKAVHGGHVGKVIGWGPVGTEQLLKRLMVIVTKPVERLCNNITHSTSSKARGFHHLHYTPLLLRRVTESFEIMQFSQKILRHKYFGSLT